MRREGGERPSGAAASAAGDEEEAEGGEVESAVSCVYVCMYQPASTCVVWCAAMCRCA